MTARILLCLGVLAFVPVFTRADAVASLYNSKQYDINGVSLVQGADEPDSFYILPREYRLLRRSKWDKEREEWDRRPPVEHRIETVNGHEFGVYTMVFDIDSPGVETRTIMAMKLRRFHPNAQIAGLVPICGIKLDLMGANIGSLNASTSENQSNATTIRYSLNSMDGAEKCKSTMSVTRFTVVYRVPIEQDANVKEALESEYGLVLPPVELVIRNKYTDQIFLKINKRRMMEQLKGLVDLKGTFKVVQAGVKAGVEDAMRRVQVNGDLFVNCHDVGSPGCQAFLEYVRTVIARDLLVIKPDKVEGDTAPLVIGDQNKAVDAAMFSVSLAYDFAKLEEHEVFTFGYTGKVYDTIRTQVQLRANKVRF